MQIYQIKLVELWGIEPQSKNQTHKDLYMFRQS